MADPKSAKQPDQVFTSADRIRQLNEVDKDVAKLIHSAGLAIQALTNARSGDAADRSLDAHKARFKEATAQYFALLSSIDVRLRRQAYALEEAAILPPELSDGGGVAGGAAGGAAVAAGAANPLDISWLNSRKDTVGKDKEAELWAAAREFVEQMGPGGKEGGQEGGQGKMEMD
ncbi:mediator complex protein-domain-containing protein [Aspergillus taichungensis]|uniref:Mediator of RNA polymerase II transcription subunit 11 n=1 Tax=Aspergillus taichungensis TaxID=482145 RepID=A0A2J5HL89_9EURO|nr:mediator complex protein-domain-containing protein [Aspergillus taichungensis]